MSDMMALRPALSGVDASMAESTRISRNLQSVKDNPSKIEKSAYEFEALLVGKWLEQAQQSFATIPGGEEDKDADPGHDQLQSISIQALASSISKNGGLGIAKMILKSIHASDSPVPVESKGQIGQESTPTEPNGIK
jgi:Rod binding domain-containing protein